MRRGLGGGDGGGGRGVGVAERREGWLAHSFVH